jgi:di/tripeptidase
MPQVVVVWLIAPIEADIEVDLVSLDGGSKHNAIPRECFADCRVPESSIGDLQAVADRCLAEIQDELSAIEPDMEVVTETMEDTAELREVLNAHARDRILMMLDGLPHGVLSMSREVPGLVESSSNLALTSYIHATRQTKTLGIFCRGPFQRFEGEPDVGLTIHPDRLESTS